MRKDETLKIYQMLKKLKIFWIKVQGIFKHEFKKTLKVYKTELSQYDLLISKFTNEINKVFKILFIKSEKKLFDT